MTTSEFHELVKNHVQLSAIYHAWQKGSIPSWEKCLMEMVTRLAQRVYNEGADLKKKSSDGTTGRYLVQHAYQDEPWRTYMRTSDIDTAINRAEMDARDAIAFGMTRVINDDGVEIISFSAGHKGDRHTKPPTEEAFQQADELKQKTEALIERIEKVLASKEKEDGDDEKETEPEQAAEQWIDIIDEARWLRFIEQQVPGFCDATKQAIEQREHPRAKKFISDLKLAVAIWKEEDEKQSQQRD